MIVFLVLVLFASSSCGLQTFAKGVEKRVDIKALDICSPSHLIRDILFILVPYYFGVPFGWCCAIDIGITALYEIFESQVVERFWYNYGAESNKNRITDIIISVVACGVTWLLITYAV